jgi:hypothetical protein
MTASSNHETIHLGGDEAIADNRPHCVSPTPLLPLQP